VRMQYCRLTLPMARSSILTGLRLTQPSILPRWICLGENAKDEFHVVEIVPPKSSIISTPVHIATLKLSILPMVTGLDLTPPITFRLKSGSGPVYLAGQHVTEDLTWGTHIEALVKRAQQRLYCLRLLRKQQLNEKLLVTFYHCTIVSILTYCHTICVWFANCTGADRTALQRVRFIAQRIIGCPLPALEEPYSSHCLKKVQNILKDPSSSWAPFFLTITIWQTVQDNKNKDK
uniref:Alkylated DNA repair protein AlkB homologue 8 N-terminal domain-containing protein n=1 Tax=Naja naja TaxID=35670 RepID=A0A8C7DVZ4_NAJNA